MRKKSKEDEQTLEELNSAYRHSQSKCQLVQTSYIKRIKLFLFLPYNKHLINRANMAGEMVQNSQSLYSFTFNALIGIHEYIYSHSTIEFTPVQEIYLFTFTCVFLIHDYICSHLQDVFIHIQRVMYQSNRSFNIPPPRAYLGHLTYFPAREGGNLINLVFPGAGI